MKQSSVERWVPWAALFPIPLWFVWSTVSAGPAAWRARYHAEPGATVSAEVFERQLSHLWSGQFATPPPGDVPVSSFAAEYDACLKLESPSRVPFMLVADGNAHFSIDGVQALAVMEPRGRGVDGQELALTSGTHHLQVVFRARNRPSVGLLASFDGEVPVALGSGRIVPGVRVWRPNVGGSPCSPER